MNFKFTTQELSNKIQDQTGISESEAMRISDIIIKGEFSNINKESFPNIETTCNSPAFYTIMGEKGSFNF